MDRTTQEIIARIEAIKEHDWLGTEQSDLIDFLPYEDAKQYLKPEVTKEQWEARTVTPPLEQAKDYLTFAWDKANNCRGLSAGRSLNHLRAWLWLAGHDEIVDGHFNDYTHYGKFQLVIASEVVGFNWRSQDDGAWVNDESGPSIGKSEINDYAARAKKLAEKAVAA